MQGGIQIEEEVLTKKEYNNLIEEYLQPKEKEPIVQFIKDIRRMVLKKGDSLLEEEAEVEEDNLNVLNVAIWDIDILSVHRTNTWDK